MNGVRPPNAAAEDARGAPMRERSPVVTWRSILSSESEDEHERDQ